MGWFDFGGSALSAFGSYFGQQSANTANRAINRENNVFSAQQAQLNRSFQERMSNTSWQRGVADMKAAGVNPMLAFSQGGASQPSGNSAQGIAQANQQNEISGAVNSAWDAAATIAQLKTAAVQNRNTEAQTKKTQADTQAVKAVQPIRDLEGSIGGLGKTILRLGARGLSRSTNSAFKFATKAARHDKFGRWNKRTGVFNK